MLYGAYILALWVNEGSRIHVARWSIGTVEIKEHCIYILAENFDEILFLFTYPSSRRNIETSKGYQYFTLDRSSDIRNFKIFMLVTFNIFSWSFENKFGIILFQINRWLLTLKWTVHMYVLNIKQQIIIKVYKMDNY